MYEDLQTAYQPPCYLDIHTIIALHDSELNPVTNSKVAGGEPERIMLLQDVVPHLNCTLYSEIGIEDNFVQ